MPTTRDWERSALLEPRQAPRIPDLVSDGGGLPFSPHAFEAPPAPLDPDDPAVAALAAFLDPSAGASLGGWRLLGREDGEAMFGLGRPPQLRLVAMQYKARRGKASWACVSQSTGRPLRVTRGGVRASSWQPDPNQELRPADTVLRILVTEQTYAGGRRADGRVETPELFESADELVLTMFVTPQQGFQMRSPNPATPVRVALSSPVGMRDPIDGALYEPPET
jgi:hypothetical protein